MPQEKVFELNGYTIHFELPTSQQALEQLHHLGPAFTGNITGALMGAPKLMLWIVDRCKFEREGSLVKLKPFIDEVCPNIADYMALGVEAVQEVYGPFIDSLLNDDRPLAKVVRNWVSALALDLKIG